MPLYQITKYNPENRDKLGRYCVEEWTSISDIGKNYGEKVFDINTYIATEDSYINAITMLMKYHDTKLLYVRGLEKNFNFSDLKIYIKKFPTQYAEGIIELFNSVEEDSKLDYSNIQLMCRLILREHLWSELYSKEKHFIVTFGYDYYMRVDCPEIQGKILKDIHNEGLYVEVIN